MLQCHSGGDNVVSKRGGYRISDPLTFPSLISLGGFCGRKAQCVLPGGWPQLGSQVTKAVVCFPIFKRPDITEGRKGETQLIKSRVKVEATRHPWLEEN